VHGFALARGAVGAASLQNGARPGRAAQAAAGLQGTRPIPSFTRCISRPSRPSPMMKYLVPFSPSWPPAVPQSALIYEPILAHSHSTNVNEPMVSVDSPSAPPGPGGESLRPSATSLTLFLAERRIVRAPPRDPRPGFFASASLRCSSVRLSPRRATTSPFPILPRGWRGCDSPSLPFCRSTPSLLRSTLPARVVLCLRCTVLGATGGNQIMLGPEYIVSARNDRTHSKKYRRKTSHFSGRYWALARGG